MKYGDKYTTTYTHRITGESFTSTTVYKYASWKDYHTNNEGDGLWRGDHQLLGTCQFTVSGCDTEKSAVAKIRKYVKKAYLDEED